ncbi:Serine/threonine-protein kinase PrkC [Anatilimnocola aggregata]|uniref:Serine/threonine-protein kinase PrkC n=1 Tax=Anatilimnocola aggregata TaxID=2528021 RepID=A0A517YKW7_9BACT|nr:serine/threonine-protein kinase [Anatilimnocola aggregata]QDU30869.1 Serine/threonine-protein kinase PrkC [Anatilimnocola aggregata]
MSTTRSMFRSSALLSGLVTQDQYDEATKAVRAAALIPSEVTEIDEAALATKLIEMKLLTVYQAEQIKAGRTKLNLGPYVITDSIGHGGMGQVFKGVHRMMGRECAVKVLPLHKATPEAVTNFMREIRTQAQLDHPNLVRAYDAGCDGKVHYLVTEYVPGMDLRRLVRSQGPLTQQQAASVVLQSARGLAEAHERGLIHRDVKPGNILVTPEGIAKVSDLGLAGFMEEADRDPRAGKVVGTADYLSPEQIRTPRDIGTVSDIYSLGCTLYYSVCGKVPFPGGTARDKARRHCEETPWHPRRFNPELHEEFVDVIADMMEKDPTKRIQTCDEVVARLEQWAGDLSPIATPKVASSPWTTQALPVIEDDRSKGDGAQDTDASDHSVSSSAPGQFSQVTGSLAGGSQDTTTLSKSHHKSSSVFGFHFTPPANPASIVLLTLAVSVPISMALGALVASFLLWLMRS